MKTMNIRKNASYILMFTFVIFIMGGCGGMDETYRDFLKDGRIIYTATPGDSLNVHPGRNRLKLSWPAAPDPKVSEARIYWNSRSDSLMVNIKNPSNGRVDIMINDLPEGTYLFEMYTYDDLGHRSVKKDFVGHTFADRYQQTLLVRPVNEAIIIGNEVTAYWGGNPNSQAYYTEIEYTDLDNKARKVRAYANADISVLDNFPPDQTTIRYRTAYLPTPLAIDTFFTDYDTQRVKGPAIELSKTGWTAETSSFDDRAGANYRPGSNAIDGNQTTIWVNKTSTPYNVYPHTITVDMKAIYENLEGFAIITRVGDAAARPKEVELFTSLNGADWVPHGRVELANSGDKQMIEISEPIRAQYFRMVGINAHVAGGNIALAEIGMYYR